MLVPYFEVCTFCKILYINSVAAAARGRGGGARGGRGRGRGRGRGGPRGGRR